MNRICPSPPTLKSKLARRVLPALFVFLATAVLPAKGPQDAKPAAPAKAEAPKPAAKKDFVGSETCAGCHDEISTGFKTNRHVSLETNKRRGWDGKACESCHGPGSIHAETTEKTDILNPASMSAPKADALCLSCHKNTPTMTGMLQGGHGRNATACTSCHNVHKTGAESSHQIHKSKTATNQQCASCHPAVMASFQRPHRHRVNEGAMGCTDCHNPHAAF